VEPWLPDGRPESLRAVELLVPRVLDGHGPLTSEERTWLERAARHPAQAEIARLARAADADIVTARWDTSAFAHASMTDLPILRFGAFREGLSIHLAMGLLAAERGDRETAETMFREVISVGLLLVRSGPTLIDALLGASIAQLGGEALRAFWASTGRTADANAIRFALEGAQRAEAMTKSLQPLVDSHGTLTGMMAVAGNTDLPPSLRWASLLSARRSASCLSTNTVLFGHDAEYDAWLEQMRASLVRFPSDDALFRIQENDPAPGNGRSSRHVSAIRRLLRFTFGDEGPAGSCAGLASIAARLY